MQRANALLHYIPSLFPYFSQCGTNRFLIVRRRRGIARRVGSTRGNRHTSISWTLIHLIMINACNDFMAVDLINQIRRPRFNSALDEPRIDTWPLNYTPMKIGRTKSRGVESASWDHGPLIMRDHSHPKFHQQIRRTAIFAIKSV